MELRKIKLPYKVKKRVLALGSQTKNRVCLLENNLAYLGPTHADLNVLQDFLDFQVCVKYFLKKRPLVIALDMHPDYQSSKYAYELKAPGPELRTIQHHHAHIASCMLENGLKNQKVIGVAFDGTGLGADNRIWGAEFLICDYKNFKRSAHLKEIPLLGAEKAIREPYRIAAAWLYLIYKEKFLNLKIDFVSGLDKKNWQVLRQMYLQKFNAPLACSMGRLFDAVASLVLARYRADFEAQLAIELEKSASVYKQKAYAYEFKIIQDKYGYIIDPTRVFKGIVKDLQKKLTPQEIAYRFHLTVGQMIKETCLVLRNNTKINQVVLSGGSFQNNLLLSLSLDLLYRQGFIVYTHRHLACNDSSISLGQAMIASM